jgi:hypothetical protein
LALVLVSAPDVIRDRTPLETFRMNVRRGGRFVPGELVIAARSLDQAPAVMHAGRALGCKEERRFGKRPLYLVRCEGSLSMERLIAGFEKIEGVRWIDASWIEEEEAVPNDLDETQWYHRNVGQEIDGFAGVAGADIGSIEAWDVTTGSEELVILISDVGVYPDHVDLADQIWQNEDEDCGNGVDDDANGYIDDCVGWDFADDDNNPDPTTLPALRESGSDCPKWHASMIAGLAGARGDNGAGVAGVNWRVSFMNVKKHRDVSCLSTTTRSTEAVAYGIDNGAHVISMSFNSSSYSATFEAALQEADRAGLVMVSSGGNGGTDDDLEERYPNQYDLEASLVVANSTNQDVLSPGSNWGARTVDMAAPGTDVVSTSAGGPNEYAFGTGASYSAGFAAGAVTLVWAAFPALTNLEVTRAIEEGVRPLESMDCASTSRCVRTGGRIDLAGALKRASGIAAASLTVGATAGDGTLDPGEEANLALAVMNTGRGAAYGLTVRIADAGGLEVVAGEATLGDLAPGAMIDLQDSLRVRAPGECRTLDATVVLAFSDRFGNGWDHSAQARVECVPDPMKPGDPMDPDGGEQHDDDSDEAGCTSARTPRTSAIWLLFLGLLFVARRR